MANTTEEQLLSAIRTLSQDIRNNSEVMLGQYGSTFSDAGDPVTPPAGYVIVAISFLGVMNLSSLVAASHSDDLISFGTADAGAGSGGVVIDANNKFASGSTIYGRWDSVSISADASTAGIICYFGI